MDFVLASDNLKLDGAHLNEAVTSNQTVNTFEGHGCCLVSGFEEQGECVFFAGHILSPAAFYFDADPNKNVPSENWLKENQYHIFGSYCAVYRSSKGLTLYTDAFGLYPLFTFNSSNGWMLSTDPNILVAVARDNRLSIGKDIEAVAVGLACMTPLNLDSGYEQIKQFRGNQGKARDGRLNDNSNTYLTALFNLDSVDLDRVEGVATSFKASIQTMLNTTDKLGINVAIDLTGGKDSRIVAAAALESVQQGKAGFFTLGTQNRPDKYVSNAFLYKFNGQPGSFVKAGEPKVNFADKLTKQVWRCHGIKLSEFNVLSTNRVEDFMRVSGRGGELTRVYYHYCIGKSRDYIINSMSGKNSFTTKGVKELVSSRINKLFDEYENQGLTDTQSLVAFYLENRCKSHFGMSFFSENRTMSAVMPLVGAPLLRLGVKAFDSGVAENKVIFKLIESMAGKEVADFPLVDDAWTGVPESKLRPFDYKVLKGISPHVENSTLNIDGLEFKNVNESPLRKSFREFINQEQAKEFSLKANSEGREYVIALLPSFKAIFLDIYNRYPNLAENEAARFIDIESVKAFCDEEHETDVKPVMARSLFRVVSALIWTLDLTSELRITSNLRLN